jgi:O-glycosyl hydrolase
MNSSVADFTFSDATTVFVNSKAGTHASPDGEIRMNHDLLRKVEIFPGIGVMNFRQCGNFAGVKVESRSINIDRKAGSQFNIASPVQRLIIGTPRNYSRNFLLLNLAADPQLGPHTNNSGCPMCEGALALEGDAVTRNVAYHTVAHVAKFVRPGSVHIASNSREPLPNVAFKTPDGQRVLIVANSSGAAQTFRIRYHGEAVSTTLSAGSAGINVW